MQFLIVDDHSIVTMALEMLLKDYGGQSNTVYSANTKEEAVALADQYGETADLMILDLSMPGVQGTSLMEEIVAAHPTLKILVMSGLQDQHSIIRVLQPQVLFRSHLRRGCSLLPSALCLRAASIFR